MEQQPIQENLWWVIADKLAGVRKPIPQELSQLMQAGIGAIVSVMDDSANLDLYECSKIPYLWLPIKGGTAPTREQIEQLKDFIDTQNELGHGVAVHCTSGRRRTGTMLASYLIQAGSSYEEAMQTILTSNPDVELREDQMTFLRQLASQ